MKRILLTSAPDAIAVALVLNVAGVARFPGARVPLGR